MPLLPVNLALELLHTVSGQKLKSGLLEGDCLGGFQNGEGLCLTLDGQRVFAFKQYLSLLTCPSASLGRVTVSSGPSPMVPTRPLSM